MILLPIAIVKLQYFCFNFFICKSFLFWWKTAKVYKDVSLQIYWNAVNKKGKLLEYETEFDCCFDKAMPQNTTLDIYYTMRNL